MAAVRPRYLPIPYQDSAEAGRLILRDGSTATVQVARPQDRKLLAAFFKTLSKRSFQRRFFSATVPLAKLIESFCDDADRSQHLCLIVSRATPAGPRVIA